MAPGSQMRALVLENHFRSFTRDAGVDVLSFGGTKNGMMFGEAIIFFNTAPAVDFKFIRKQGMQLHSKMRFIGSQFNALLSNDLWRRNAEHSNNMARKLAEELKKYPQIEITQSVDANGVFAIFPPEIIPELQKEHFFYMWTEKIFEARLMCAFDTSEDEIRNFGKRLRELLG